MVQDPPTPPVHPSARRFWEPKHGDFPFRRASGDLDPGSRGESAAGAQLVGAALRRARRPGRCHGRRGPARGGGAAGSPGAGGGGGAPRRHGHGYDARPPRLPRLLAPNSGADVAASFRVPAGPPRRRRRQHPGLPGAGAPSPAPAPARLTVNAPRVGARPPGGRELRLVSGARCASRLLLLWSPAPLRPGAPGTESQELRAAA